MFPYSAALHGTPLHLFLWSCTANVLRDAHERIEHAPADGLHLHVDKRKLSENDVVHIEGLCVLVERSASLLRVFSARGWGQVLENAFDGEGERGELCASCERHALQH